MGFLGQKKFSEKISRDAFIFIYSSSITSKVELARPLDAIQGTWAHSVFCCIVISRDPVGANSMSKAYVAPRWMDG